MMNSAVNQLSFVTCITIINIISINDNIIYYYYY